jgi:transcriptional regulator with XRE-family HTH domain
MAESKNSKRVIFRPGEQKKFLLDVKEKIGGSWKNIAESLGVHPRTVSAWRNEENSLTFGALSILCELASCSMPSNIGVRDQYWYVGMAAQKGGVANYKINGKVGGDEKHRKEQWRKWWDDEGKLKLPQTKAKKVHIPEFSEEFAEFIGIILGDGGINKNQITITLNSVDDKEYSQFVESLVKNLFHIPIGTYQSLHALAKRLVISRTALVDYLTSDLVGLEKGNKVKQQVDIPQWVRSNEEYTKACIRGLLDTDGCVIIHRYQSKGKRYSYKKIGFTSHSYPLLRSVSAILSHLSIGHRVMKNQWEIRIEAQEEVRKYFQIIGTHNPKHLKRYKL